MTEVCGGAEGSPRGALPVAGGVGRETGLGGETEREVWVTAVVSHTQEQLWR